MEHQARLEDWLSLRPALIHIYRGPVPKEGAHIKAPPGGNHYAWFLLQGAVTVTSNGETATAHAGEWLIAYPGLRTQQFTPDARIISVQFQAKWPDGCQLFEEGLSLVIPDADCPQLKREALHLLKKLGPVLNAYPTKIRHIPLSLETYLTMQHLGLGFLAILARALLMRGIAPPRVGKTDERLLAIMHILNRWPLQLPLEKARLVKTGSMSADHLARRFKAAFGLSPRKYLENRRLDFARRMLTHSAMPAKEIASELGFTSLSDFSTWFKRHHGIAPNPFRKKILQMGQL